MGDFNPVKAVIGLHANTHKGGGSDVLKLDELATPTDVTTLNATIDHHGLLPKLPGGNTNFLREDGTWQPAAGGSGDTITINGVSLIDADFDDSIPAAPGSGINIKWQKDSNSPANVSAYIEAATTTTKGVVELATDGETNSGVVVQGNDARLSNTRDPNTHASTHLSNGSDPIAQASTTIRGTVELATDGEVAGNLVPQANDTRLSNARTPTAHKDSHKSGGGDAFVKTDILIAASRYLETKADPASDTGAFWLEAGTKNIKFWDNLGTPVKQTLEVLTNKGAASGYCDLDSSTLVPLARLPSSVILDTESNQITDTLISAHTSTKITITDKTHLNSNILYKDIDNDIGDHFLDIGDIAAPGNPSAGIRRIFLDTATGKLSVKTSSGSIVSLEEGGAGAGEANTSSNVGTGEGLLAKAKVGVDLPFKSLKAGTNITITNNTDDVTIAASGGAGGEANTASNQGTGEGTLVLTKSGVDLPFKTIKQGTNITITNNATDVTISSADTGEVNTSSNVGTGLGWAKTKSGVDLPFRSITASSTKITLADNTNDIGIDVNQANLTLDSIGGTLGIAKGGTGQGSATAAFDALSPLTTLGDLLYNNGTNDARLAGNTLNAKRFLSQTGNGSVSAAPVWDTIASGDLPSHTHTKSQISDFAHASTHIAGGNDTIKIDDLVAADDNSDLNATTGAHGLLPKLGGGTTNYLRADGTWAQPPDTNTDTKVVVREANVQVGSAARVLNFTVSGNFDIVEDIPNDEIEIDIADNAITDSLISAHTSTKITITDKTHLNSSIAYIDQANSWGDFAQTFKDNQLKINNPADTFAMTIICPALAAARNLTLPLLTGNDIAVAEAFAATLTNKTINATNNTITDTSTAAGDLLKSNGTKFVRMQRGSALQVLRTNSGATDLEFASLNSENTGTASGNANGSATVFNIAHSLGTTPYMAFVVVSSVLGSTIDFSYTYDGTNIVVTFASAPSTGTITFQWRAVA